ncbi:MAG: inositol 2-dehydrogenase [bacterium]|nr:inositol 2-dehydrogenase [bacterium]
MSTVRVGLLGCGRIGRMHAGLLARHVPGAELGAVYDVVEGAAAAVGGEHGVRCTASAPALIEADDIDAVAICTSSDTHADLLVAAAAAGKPAFVEKPPSLSLAELDRAIAAAQAAGVAVQVGFNRRFDASHRYVRDQVAGGAIGEVHLMRITSRDPEPPPNIQPLEVSGGLFCNMTIHDFDMVRFVSGLEVTEVYATGGVHIDEAIGTIGDLDTAVVVLRHTNGAISTIDNSRRAVYGYDQRVEVFGSAGMVASDNPPVATAHSRGPGGAIGPGLPYFFVERYRAAYLAGWSEFVAMANGAPSPCTLAEGRASLVLALAAWRSVRERRPVDIEEIR